MGFPDPLSIILICITGLSLNNRTKFLSALLAGLTHFSMALIGLVSVIIIIYYQDKHNKKEAIKKILLGIVYSKIFLEIWYFIFEYKLNSRMDIVKDTGLDFYVQRYLDDVAGFWLTPGVLFVITYCSIFVYYLMSKKFRYAYVLLVPLLFSYVAHFITTDGLRVFAVTISGAYVLILYKFIEENNCFLNKVVKVIKNSVISITPKKNEIFIAEGMLITVIWVVLIIKAKGKGLFINGASFLNRNILVGNLKDLLMIIAPLAIFITITFSRISQKEILIKVMNIIFISPILIVVFQFVRLSFMNNYNLTVSDKVLILICILILSGININYLKISRSLGIRVLKLIKSSVS